MALIIRIDGTRVSISPEYGEQFTLEELQTVVGGYIEIIKLSSDAFLIINEDGNVLGLPLNRSATQLYGAPIVGNVMFVSNTEIDYT